MSKKILYISDGFSIDEYALDSDNSDLEVEENVDFILDASELANPNFVSIDSFYHKRIGELEFDDYGLILIPTSLSEDVYISFSGIRLGVHLRLDAMSRYIPILFIGPDSFTELCKFSDYAGFLSSPGIYTLSEGKNQVKDIASLAKYILNNSHPLTGDDYLLSLDKFNLKTSGLLDSRHSRANEYGLLKLDIESGHNVFANNKKSLEIVSDLYTKWLLAKSGLELPTAINKVPKKQGFTIPSEGKRILIIDDEWGKGWLELYKKIFLRATVEHLPIQKGNKWEEDIKLMLKEKLQEEWDLFLVDIRLADEDFNNTKYESLSGLKALNLIKQKNQGFQVCITSASNKHKVYDFARKKGADEVFIKPSIEDDSGLLYFKRSINNLNGTISQALKKYWQDYQDVINLVNKKKSEKRIEVSGKKSIENMMLFSFDFLEKSASNNVYLESALYYLYLVLETVGSKLFSEAEEIDRVNYTYCWRGTDDSIKAYNWKNFESSSWVKPYKKDFPKIEFISHKDKLANLLDSSGVLDLRRIKEIIDLRNNLSHPSLIKRNNNKVELAHISDLVNAVQGAINRL